MNLLYSALTGIFGHPDPVGESGTPHGTAQDGEVNTWRPPHSSTARKARKRRDKASKAARKRNRR